MLAKNILKGFNIKNIFCLCFSIFLAQCAGIIGSFFTRQSVSTWYQTIEKPTFNPPDFIFAPVWIMLYVIMGIAAFIIWNQKDHPLRKTALVIYLVQLILNTLWPFLFFACQAPLASLFEIILLTVSIIMTIYYFYTVKFYAGILMLPYLAWVSFATLLNYYLWILNR